MTTPLHRDVPPYKPLRDRLGLRRYLPDTLRARLAEPCDAPVVNLEADLAAQDLVEELDWADDHLMEL